MKKIILSLAVIAAVGAIVVGATTAYFSDTETNTGNTFTTGTINIDIAENQDWTDGFKMEDMKPSQTEYINFKVNNVGTNPVNIYKKLTDIETYDNGAPNEPECLDSGGSWNGTECSSNYVAKSDINNYINYDLSVKVYADQNATEPLWQQIIYTDSDGKTISDVYGSLNSDDKGVLLGMVPAGGYMLVEQSYHLQSEVGNWAQNDSMNFNISVIGEQLTNTVTMVSKSASSDWSDIDQDEYSAGKYATLSYKVKDSDFKYDFEAHDLTPNTDYVVLSGTNPYNGSDTVKITSFTTDGSGDFSEADQAVDLNQDLTNAKMWVVLASDWTGGPNMAGWHGDSYLFETALMDYYDTND